MWHPHGKRTTKRLRNRKQGPQNDRAGVRLMHEKFSLYGRTEIGTSEGSRGRTKGIGAETIGGYSLMASSSSRASQFGRKRKAEEEERNREMADERLLHLTLENGFLEEKTKLLEKEARDYRLKIGDLMREVRERTEELIVRNEIYERAVAELEVKSKSLGIVEARLKELVQKVSGTTSMEHTEEQLGRGEWYERSQAELDVTNESFEILEAQLLQLIEREAGTSGRSH
ncbi:hypothetical protein R1sor_019908 [Riccia sorocarpa]|uniref:Uncharacterized protein n=1 Tax=Riccia sorocarpa TaxID=122646 RepID=A0ABD3IEH9_9MARC